MTVKKVIEELVSLFPIELEGNEIDGYIDDKNIFVLQSTSEIKFSILLEDYSVIGLRLNPDTVGNLDVKSVSIISDVFNCTNLTPGCILDGLFVEDNNIEALQLYLTKNKALPKKMSFSNELLWFDLSCGKVIEDITNVDIVRNTTFVTRT